MTIRNLKESDVKNADSNYSNTYILPYGFNPSIVNSERTNLFSYNIHIISAIL